LTINFTYMDQILYSEGLFTSLIPHPPSSEGRSAPDPLVAVVVCLPIAYDRAPLRDSIGSLQPPRKVHGQRRRGPGPATIGRNEHSRIVLPPETGDQPSLSSDAPWLNHRRPRTALGPSIVSESFWTLDFGH
jgi:hypothetical protein